MSKNIMCTQMETPRLANYSIKQSIRIKGVVKSITCKINWLTEIKLNAHYLLTKYSYLNVKLIVKW